MGPLEGVKIIDMTSVIMGPYATQLLADLGADVIKVEAPEGDVMRLVGPMRNPAMGPLFLNANRNKRSIVLDLKQEGGRAALLKLVSSADVLVYNVRPKAMARLKLSFDEVLEANPGIVYAGVLGFGQDGPYAAKPAYDDLIQGASVLSWFMAASGDGTPRYSPNALADRVVGLAASSAILAALLNRQRTGNGQAISIPMFETMVSFVLSDHLGGMTFEPPLDGGGYQRQLSIERRPYRTSDGYVCVVIYTDKQWNRFFVLADRRDLQADKRFATLALRSVHVDVLYAELGRTLVTKSTGEWLTLFEDADIPAMRMHDIESIMQDEHLLATDFFSQVEHPTEGTLRNMKLPIRRSRGDLTPTRLAPRLGEHGESILAEAGFSGHEIDALKQSRTIMPRVDRDEQSTP